MTYSSAKYLFDGVSSPFISPLGHLQPSNVIPLFLSFTSPHRPAGRLFSVFCLFKCFHRRVFIVIAVSQSRVQYCIFLFLSVVTRLIFVY